LLKDEMALKCPDCGAEYSDGGYYCGSCGAALQDTSIPSGTHELTDTLVWDIDRVGLTIALTGLLVVIFSVLMYMYGTTYCAWFGYDPAIPWWTPFALVGSLMMLIGIVMNAAQRLPRPIQGVLVCEFYTIAIAMILSWVLAMTVTETITYTTEGGLLVEIEVFGHRSGAIFYFITVGVLPIVAGYALWTRNRIAWAVVVVISLLEMSVSWISFSQSFDPYVASITAMVQIPLIVLLGLPSARNWYSKSGVGRSAS